MKAARSMVVSMRLPVESGRAFEEDGEPAWMDGERHQRAAGGGGAAAAEFALIDFRDSPVGRQAYIQGSTLAVWEVMMIVRAYKGNAKKAADAPGMAGIQSLAPRCTTPRHIRGRSTRLLPRMTRWTSTR